MNIRDLYTRPIVSRGPEEPAPRQQQLDKEEGPRLRVVHDRVVISHKARAALNEIRTIPDVDLSIKALLNSAPLTEARALEVVMRIKNGYYQQPEVLRQIAAALTQVLDAERA